MPKIKLAARVELPAAEVATEVTAAIGIRGSGKSNVLGVLAEGMIAAGVQVVVLDPVGLWFSLRLAADGKTPSGLKVHVLGGRHADAPLTPAGGRVVATALATTGASAVLDVSAFSKADRCRFAADFAEQLLRDKKEHQGPLWLVLEEAQTFAPQVIRHGLEFMGRMLGAFEEMAETGRNFGLGLGLATQRPQKVNKEVLNLAENVLAFRLLGALERKAVRDWVQEREAPGRSEVDGMLPALAKGEAIVWSPVRGIYEQAGTPKKRTYDAGATPLAARERVRVGALDLGALEQAMTAVVEEARASDPRALRAEISRLNAQVKRLNDEAAGAHRVEVARVPALLFSQIETLVGLADAAYQTVRAQVPAVERLKGATDHALRMALSHGVLPGGPAARAARTPEAGARRGPGANGAARGPSHEELREKARGYGRALGEVAARGLREVDPKGLSGAERPFSDNSGAQRVLNVLAESHRPLTWPQARMLAGMVESGTSSNYRAQLVKAGLVAEEGGTLTLTPAGAALAQAVDRPQGGRALLDYWAGRLPGKAGAMLRALRDEGAMHRGDLISRVGLTESGTSSSYVALLLTYGLAASVGNKIAIDEMFLEQP